MAAFGFRPYYIRRRLSRWQVCSGETYRTPGARTFTLIVAIRRLPWWQFWRGWYGMR